MTGTERDGTFLRDCRSAPIARGCRNAFILKAFSVPLCLCGGLSGLIRDTGTLALGAAATRPATATASAPAGLATYRPGIRIDWRARQVEADATVVLREGAIEVFACSPGNREYESIVRMDARPLHLFQAMGLIGLTPGHPIRFNPENQSVEPAVGDPVEIEIRYTAEGRIRQEPIENWMRLQNGKRKLEPVPWVFAGSVPDEAGGVAADTEGTVIALVDFSTALIAPPERHTDRNEDLWLEPATAQIPPVGTRCVLVLRAGPLTISLDGAGRPQMSGKSVLLADVARAVNVYRRERPGGRVVLNIQPDCPATERDRLQSLLKGLGVPNQQIDIRQVPTTSAPANDPQALRNWLRDMQAELETGRRSGAASRPHWLDAAQNLAAELCERSAALHARTESALHYTAELSHDFQQLLSEPAQSQAQP